MLTTTFFSQEKPKILASVGQGTQAAQRCVSSLFLLLELARQAHMLMRSSRPSYRLVNALQHVNREKESVTTNARVQECLEKAKADRKVLIRYIQLIDQDADGDFLGTLIATNEQVRPGPA